jgi:hypothetical protein
MIKCVSLTPEINNNSSLKLSGSATHMADLLGPTIGAPTIDVNGSRESFEKRSPCWRMFPEAAYRTPAAQLFLGRVMRLCYRRTGMSQLVAECNSPAQADPKKLGLPRPLFESAADCTRSSGVCRRVGGSLTGGRSRARRGTCGQISLPQHLLGVESAVVGSMRIPERPTELT